MRWKVTCQRCGASNASSQQLCRLCGVALGAVHPASAAPSDLLAAKAPSKAPFTGREAELAALLNALDRATAGEGQWVTVTGEAGLGKSRLRWEFCQGLDPEAVFVMEGRCQANTGIAPYLPFVHAIRRSLQVDMAPATAESVGRVVDRVLRFDPDLATHLPLILHLLSLSSSNHALPNGLAGEPYRLAMEAAFLDSLAACARQRPTVLILEDWHWADEPSWSALRALLAGIAKLRVLVVVVSREETGFDWPGAPPRARLPLEPLGELETRLLIQSLLGTSRLPGGFASRVHERTAGNPFFVEEMCRSLQEEGLLQVSGADVVLTRPLDGMPLPNTIQGLLKGRVDRLNSHARDVLTLASVLGREVDPGILEQLCPPGLPLAESLADLEAHDMLQGNTTAQGPVLRFKHVLTQLAVYESISLAERRVLHGRVLRALEKAHAGADESVLEALAYHATQATSWHEAVKYNRLAGQKALTRYAFREAGAALEQALEALAHMPASAEHARQEVELRLLLHPAYVPQGRFGDLMRHMEAAHVQALTLDDAALLAQINAQRGYYHFLLGDFRAALEPSAASAKFARRSGEIKGRVTANYYAGIARYAAGDFRNAIQVLQDTIGLIPPERWLERFDSAGIPAAIARVLAGLCFAELGEFDVALPLAREGVEITERSDVVLNTAIAYWLLGSCHARRGEYDATVQVAERGLALCEERRLPMAFSQLAGAAGEAYLRLGRPEAAVNLLEQAVAPEQFNRGFKFMSPLVTLAESYLVLGFLPEARRLGADALERCRTSGDRRSEAWALRLAGMLAAHGASLPGGDAEYWCRTAVALAAELHMRPVLAHCRVGLGQALLGRGQTEAGMAEVNAALADYDAMGMAYWRTHTEQLLARA